MTQTKLSYDVYLDKIYGCFLGKTVIGTLGAPYEGIKMPLELPFKPEMINTMLPNDDLDLQVLWLDVAEKYGKNFTSAQLLERFCTCCDYSPGEYAVMRKNFAKGIYPPASGTFCNDYYISGMGCPIRSEIWACLAPLQPELAAAYSVRDGQLDHGDESVYSEMFLAALEAMAFAVDEKTCDLYALIEEGLKVIPEESRFYELVQDTVAWCRAYDDVKVILRKILFKYGHPDCTNLFENMGITIATLLKGNLDAIKTGMDALNCGFDTDCTCATAGAIIGLIRGAKSLEDEYHWGDIKFVLGVKSDRRSDSVFDFSEDIALLGKDWNPDMIEGGQVKTFDYEVDPSPVRLEIMYPENEKGLSDCAIALGESVTVMLLAENITADPVCMTYTVSGTGCEVSDSVQIDGYSVEAKPITVTIPADAVTIAETNIYTINYTAGDVSGEMTFGLSGATPWKVVGPIWRTDPICTTEKLLAVPNYWHLMQDPDHKGDQTDIVRRFHLNFAVDTDTEYMSLAELSKPLDVTNVATTYEETLFSQRQDSFTLGDVCGFEGPAVYYLVRELVSPVDEKVCVQLGHNCPVTLYINGQLIAETGKCDYWDAENIHVQNVEMKKGVNTVVLRLCEVTGNAKYNLIFSEGATCATHKTHYASVNPAFFGKALD